MGVPRRCLWTRASSPVVWVVSAVLHGQDHPDVRAVIPRRSALPVDRGVLIVAHATHKQKALFFFLVQARAPAVHYLRQIVLTGRQIVLSGARKHDRNTLTF